MHHVRITHTTSFVIPVVEHWLEREISQWVHPMKGRSDDPSHHERTLVHFKSFLIQFEQGLVPVPMAQWLGHRLIGTGFASRYCLQPSGVTESLLWGSKGGGRARPSSGGGARGRHRNEGCTIKSQMGGGGMV